MIQVLWFIITLATAKPAADYQQRILLNNTDNSAYMAGVLFGTPGQGNITTGNFYFDSCSSYTIVTTAQCTTCNTSYYNDTLSTTYSPVEGGINSISYMEPSFDVQGAMASDRVCVGSNSS